MNEPEPTNWGISLSTVHSAPKTNDETSKFCDLNSGFMNQLSSRRLTTRGFPGNRWRFNNVTLAT